MAEHSDIAYITDRHGNRTHAIVPIELFKTLLDLQELLKSGSLKHDELYFLNFKQHQAAGYPTGSRENPRFVLIKGSELALEEAESLPSRIRKIKEHLISRQIVRFDADRDAYVLTEDFAVKSVSQAALLVTGRVLNGMEVFKNKAGFSLRSSGYGRKKRKNA